MSYSTGSHTVFYRRFYIVWVAYRPSKGEKEGGKEVVVVVLLVVAAFKPLTTGRKSGSAGALDSAMC
jgi:hypothetical protein